MKRCPVCESVHLPWVKNLVDRLRQRQDAQEGSRVRLSFSIERTGDLVIDVDIFGKHENRSNRAAIAPTALDDAQIDILTCTIARTMEGV